MRNIGVCITLPHSEITREFLRGLYNEANKAGYRLFCFNSSIDFNVSRSKGAESIFYEMPFEYMDALVVMHGTFHNPEVFDDIIKKAKAANVPVIMAREESEELYCVHGDYKEALVNMIKHLVEVHNCKDVFYISGRRNISEKSKSDSSIRYNIIKDTLKELNVDFDDSKVACGEYWEFPTMKIVDEMVDSGKKLPDAIICANDIMAFTVCQRFKGYGIKVPDDVIVTGFDGLQCARFSSPRLTTCYDDITEMSQKIITMVTNLIEGKQTDRHIKYKFKTVYSKSCGCIKDNLFDESEQVQLFQSFRLNEADEDRTNKLLYKLFAVNTVEYFTKKLPDYLQNNQFVLLRNDNAHITVENIESEYVPISESVKVIANKQSPFNDKIYDLNDIYRDLFTGEENNGVYIISAINIEDFVVGSYIERLDDVFLEGALYNRHVNALNTGFLACVMKERQEYLKRNLERSKYIDSLTGFDNERGFQRYFDAFNNDYANHSKFLEYCVFSFINHDDIITEFKTDGVERCITFIADSLVAAHPEDAYIARIANDGFVVILEGTDDINRSDIVWNSVGKFYEIVQEFNHSDPNGPKIEVSSGSIDLNPGWTGDSTSFTSSAYMELYKNRVAINEGINTDEVDISLERELLNKVNIILRDNLLTYFYQPIVDAHTGDIVAYEALMRTKGDISMNPLELLSIARRHRLLYKVERLTLFNILSDYKNRQMEFSGRKLFINTIPGNFLDEKDLEEFQIKYNDYLDGCVIEITEDNSVDTDELNRIRSISSSGHRIQLAIDDYGTGHSNVMNLMQYQPNVVKIDRFLISNIHNDANKQLFVSNIVRFASENGIKVLAEGVETKEEACMSIDLGVDYIQGYYTAKPNAEIIDKIPDDIKRIIINQYTKKVNEEGKQ